MDLDSKQSLKQILGALEKDMNDSSALAKTCIALYEKPLKDFTVENLRVMIGQNIGLEYLIPLAVELLEKNPFVEGDFYPGDLLSAVMQVEPGFWRTHQDLYWSVSQTIDGLPSLLNDLAIAINRFDELRIFDDSKSQ
jgi:hypothetical protein